MSNAVKAIIDKHQYNQDIKKYSNRHFFGDHSIFAKINSKKEVEIAQNTVATKIKMYDKTYPLVREDIEDLERAVGRFEISVKKVIQCYGMSDFDYSAEELQTLIDKVFDFYNEVQRIDFRRVCQD